MGVHEIAGITGCDGALDIAFARKTRGLSAAHRIAANRLAAALIELGNAAIAKMKKERRRG